MTFEENILPLRSQIDSLDNQILELLSERLEVVRQVGVLKKQHGIPPLQPKRWAEVVEKIRNKAAAQNMNPDMIEQIWDLVHKEALKIED